LESPVPSHLKPFLDVMCEEKPDESLTEQEIVTVEFDGSAIACEQRDNPEENHYRSGHKNSMNKESDWESKDNFDIECGGPIECNRVEHPQIEDKVITWDSEEPMPLPENVDHYSPVAQKEVPAFLEVPHAYLMPLNFTPHENSQLFGIDYRASIYSWRRETDGRYYINYEAAPYVLSLILEKQPIEYMDEKVRLYIADEIIASISAFQQKGRVFFSGIGLHNVGITREGKVLLIDFDEAAKVARMDFQFNEPLLPIPFVPDYVYQAPSMDQKRKMEGHEVYKLAVLLGTILTGKSFTREVRSKGPRAYLDEFDESEVPRALRRLLVRALGKRANRPTLLDFLGSVRSDPIAQELLKDTLDSLLDDTSDSDPVLTRENSVMLELERYEMRKKSSISLHDLLITT